MNIKTKEVEKNVTTDIKDTYRIYNYLKREPSIIIALGSAIIAVGTAITNLLVYIKEKQFLDYWRVSSSNIMNSQGQLYFICATLALVIIGFLILSFINSSVTKYYLNTRGFIFCQRILKRSRLLEMKANFDRLKIRFLLFKYKIKSEKIGQNIDSKIELTNEFLTKTKEDSKKNICNIKNIKKDLKKHKKLEKFALVIKLFFAFILVYICQLIFFSLSTLMIENLWLYTAALSLIEILLFILIIFFLREEKKEIKKDVAKYLDGDEKIKDKYLNSTENQKRLIDKISDNSLKILGIQAICYFLLILIFSIVYTSEMASEKKKFYIYEYNGEHYALIYDNDNNYIFEKAQIEDDVLIINTQKQMFVNKDGILMDFLEFEEVKREGID